MDLTRSQVDAAGRRIRHAVREGDEPAEQDLATVAAFRAAHDDVAIDLTAEISALKLALVERLADQIVTDPEYAERWEVTSRLKTEDAIVAKLCRSTTSLSSMQDIAGARLVVPDLELQDLVLGILVSGLEEDGRQPRVKDTREDGDDLGYRAIHVTVRWSGRAAEIQLRTLIQDDWAQRVEWLDKELGTDLKHGSGPPDVLEWLRKLSTEGRNADLGQPWAIPPFPE